MSVRLKLILILLYVVVIEHLCLPYYVSAFFIVTYVNINFGFIIGVDICLVSDMFFETSVLLRI
jgi:hypothetical protein